MLLQFTIISQNFTFSFLVFQNSKYQNIKLDINCDEKSKIISKYLNIYFIIFDNNYSFRMVWWFWEDILYILQSDWRVMSQISEVNDIQEKLVCSYVIVICFKGIPMYVDQNNSTSPFFVCPCLLSHSYSLIL